MSHLVRLAIAHEFRQLSNAIHSAESEADFFAITQSRNIITGVAWSAMTTKTGRQITRMLMRTKRAEKRRKIRLQKGA